jgi:hypothetical protein
MFILKFSTDNAAFDGQFDLEEIARILRHIADRVVDGDDSGSVIDINGNKIGTFKYTN